MCTDLGSTCCYTVATALHRVCAASLQNNSSSLNTCIVLGNQHALSSVA